MAWLVAGLGNPGDRYARTRHNLGKMVVEELARGEGVRLKKVRFLPAEFAELREGTERVLLVTSTRYMNESGPTYAGLAKKHDVPPERIVAVHDELEIPPGELHVKLGGGSGGHNGLKSLTQALGTPPHHRVHGVVLALERGLHPGPVLRPPSVAGPAGPSFTVGGVKQISRDMTTPQPGSEPDTQVEPDIAIWVERAAEAVRSLIGDGLPPTQDRFNRGAGRG